MEIRSQEPESRIKERIENKSKKSISQLANWSIG